MERKFDLEKRLTAFAVMMIKIAEHLPPTKAGSHLAGQLIRCGTSPALNYGEAQSGESRKDFIHKIRIVLKELRETKICLNLINNTGLCNQPDLVHACLRESDELISIFVKSVETALRNSG